ncbi:hypothetical protein GLW08_06955 [Pontibacillus yanchengensis]|uniref:ABC-2 type transporter transmembrane domain-containing protein n=2 Tax=Pontibacillus yanchengensis TaxID=462910 RepID=A0A6I4ZQG0_9BACI|nr:ABC transporter permease [Pontibacillus yanchengensis]MYL32495.1 hypothetical protein [Pontibacillus yanchengensis]MYL53076.1 hypothetical protein [Pontibacillus yanchengensis]
MLTYLGLQLRRWKTKPFVALISMMFPFLCFFILAPFLTSTTEKTTIPIAIVDEDESTYSQRIVSRLTDQQRLSIQLLPYKDMVKALQKGEVEAGFVLQEGLENEIKAGAIQDTITWMRTSNSTLDVFIKEQLGAELMRIALNAKAANTVMEASQSNKDWEEVYQYSASFWEPSPLFEMNFIKRTPSFPQQDKALLANWHKTVLVLFFFYAWTMSIWLCQQLWKDKQNGVLDRLSLVQLTPIRYYLGQGLSIWLVSLMSFLIAICAMGGRVPWDLLLQVGLWASIVLTGTIVVTYAFYLMFKLSSATLIVIESVAVVTVVATLLNQSGVSWIGDTVVPYFPPSWLMHNPFIM